ncbi:hypothetical protein [Aquicoccus sp. SU-CL01552]|uniref:hypothetical protein n=1 Tax=Aquicoccus sp. SU-CL01552 TaxID=3127656 RepID=UPI00310C77AB
MSNEEQPRPHEAGSDYIWIKKMCPLTRHLVTLEELGPSGNLNHVNVDIIGPQETFTTRADAALQLHQSGHWTLGESSQLKVSAQGLKICAARLVIRGPETITQPSRFRQE